MGGGGGGQEKRTGVTLKWAGSERPAMIEGKKGGRSISSPLPTASVTF